MDEGDIVIVPTGSQMETEGALEAVEDFVDLRPVNVESDRKASKVFDRTPVLQYFANFHRLFGVPGTYERLKHLSYSCQLDPGGFRSLCWSFWLNLFPGCDPNEWVTPWLQRREVYERLKEKYCLDNRCDSTVDPCVNNPLSQAAESPWNVYFLNAELKKEIERDVVRTCPENDTFKDETIRNIMIEILFIYCKEYKNLSYRQGMHEILGSLLLVWKGDVENFIRISKFTHQASTTSSERYLPVLSKIFSEKHIEHDIYFMFEKVMEHMWDWYYPPERPHGSLTRRPFPDPQQEPFMPRSELDDLSQCNAIRRLRNMWTNIFQLHDQDLYDHLEALCVLPTTFGVNWTKLIFSRQFKAYLSLWDAIFASKFLLVDYIVVAMVLSIRDLLIGGDSNHCNSLLVARYPTNVRVNFVIALALYLQDTINYTKPRGSPFQLPRVENPVASLSPLRDNDDFDVLTGSFDILSRDECPNPRDANLRDTYETVEASLNELRHNLQIQRLPSENVMNAYQRLESSVQALGRQLFGRGSHRNSHMRDYSVGFDALGLRKS